MIFFLLNGEWNTFGRITAHQRQRSKLKYDCWISYRFICIYLALLFGDKHSSRLASRVTITWPLAVQPIDDSGSSADFTLTDRSLLHYCREQAKALSLYLKWQSPQTLYWFYIFIYIFYREVLKWDYYHKISFYAWF